MAPFRPTNINKRAYPGNANVVGPVTQPSCTESSSFCFSCNCTLCGTPFIDFVLGCRYHNCKCNCCHCCCCCCCVVCTRITPGGMYSANEVNEYRNNDTWGPSTCSNEAPIGFCSTSGVITGASVDCFSYLISGTNWWASIYQSNQSAPCGSSGLPGTCPHWGSVSQSCTNFGNLGWCTPNCGGWLQAPYNCKTYWWNSGNYWTNEQGHPSGYLANINMTNGTFFSCRSWPDCYSLNRSFRNT